MFYRLGEKGEPIRVGSSFEAQVGLSLLRTSIDDALVSTIFIGIEHPGGMLFETMSFEGGRAVEQERYRTICAAVAGHHVVVSDVATRYATLQPRIETTWIDPVVTNAGCEEASALLQVVVSEPMNRG